MAFKKSFLLVSLILAAALNVQTAFAMEGVDEETRWSISKVLNTANKRLGQARDLIDELKGISPQKTISPSQSVRDSEARFFSELSDEVALLYIFPFLCEDEVALEELSAVALTCRQGYHLVQDPSLWKPLEKMLKKCYFAHALEDDLSRFIASKDLPPLALAHTLYQRFLIDLQPSEETFKILLNQPVFRSRYPKVSLKYYYDICFKGPKARSWIYLQRDIFRHIERQCTHHRMAWA